MNETNAAVRSLIGEGGERVTDFEEIYAPYFDGVFRYVLSLCGDAGMAEEVTQEAFYKAMEG